MDLPPLPGDSSLAGIGDGQAGPLTPFPRGPGPGGAPQGEEAEAARRKGLEAANRKRRGKAEEALVEALKRLQARGEAITAKKTALRGPRRRGVWGAVFSPPPLFPGLLGPLQAAVEGFAGEGRTSGLGSRVDPTLLPGPPRPAQRLLGGPWGAGGTFPWPRPPSAF